MKTDIHFFIISPSICREIQNTYFMCNNIFDMSYSWVSFWWKVTWQRNAEWRHIVSRPCDTMRIRRRAYRNTIMLIRSSVLYGTMYRVASICFCIFHRCTSHRTMYMTHYTTYTWIRHDSVKGEYDTRFFDNRDVYKTKYKKKLL